MMKHGCALLQLNNPATLSIAEFYPHQEPPIDTRTKVQLRRAGELYDPSHPGKRAALSSTLSPGGGPRLGKQTDRGFLWCQTLSQQHPAVGHASLMKSWLKKTLRDCDNSSKSWMKLWMSSA